MKTELRLLKKIKKNGDRQAANELIKKYYEEIYHFFYKQTIDVELSYDLTQEFFIYILTAIQRYDHKKASLRTWLYMIASNRLIDYYRSKNYKTSALTTLIEQYDDELSEEDLSLTFEYKEDVEQVIQIINQLDLKYQQVLRLKIFAECTFIEIAEMEKVSESTVKTRYYAAIRKIRESLKEDE